MGSTTLLAAFVIATITTQGASDEVKLGDPGSWIGKHSDQLVKSWGEPSKIKKLSGQNRVFVYKLRFDAGKQVSSAGWYFDDRNQPQTISGSDQPHGAAVMPGTVGLKQSKIKIKFYVDPGGYVYKARYPD
jgi:hypothetical protein